MSTVQIHTAAQSPVSKLRLIESNDGLVLFLWSYEGIQLLIVDISSPSL